MQRCSEPATNHASAISTPAPAWGATIQTAVPFIMAWYFQLTHPVRGATRREPVIFLPSAISTPAPMQGVTLAASIAMSLCSFQFPHPAWGATRLIPRRPWKSDISIPAPCEGCDIILIKKKRRRLVFQFTHPVWGAAQRLRTDILKIIIKYFNSRTLMRYGLTVSP